MNNLYNKKNIEFKNIVDNIYKVTECYEKQKHVETEFDVVWQLIKEKCNEDIIIPFKSGIINCLLGAWYSGVDVNTNTKIVDIYDLTKKLEEKYNERKTDIFDAFIELNNFSNKYYNTNIVSNVICNFQLGELKCRFDEITDCADKNKWQYFENFTEKFIEYYFQGYIGRLCKQKVADENLHRYDAIAPISIEKNDSYFFEIIKNCFNCRYIVFEAKCFSKSISQDEIWRTSKYLYKQALRSIAIIVTSSVYNDHNAELTQKGLLREQGKLILVVDKKDIENILNDKLSIDELLKEKIDNLMMSINT